MTPSKVDRVYAAKTMAEQEAGYDAWASDYERDLMAMGYNAPAVIAAVFAHYVPKDAAPILDAGCGGGLQAEPLALLGYGPITGIDLSDGMLEVARHKKIYAELRHMAMGEGLDFPADHFAATLSCGTITPGHAPASSFDDLIEVTRKDGLIIFSLRCDEAQEPAYDAHIAELTKNGRWDHVFSTDPYACMPFGEPHVLHRIHVYRVL